MDIPRTNPIAVILIFLAIVGLVVFCGSLRSSAVHKSAPDTNMVPVDPTPFP